MAGNIGFSDLTVGSITGIKVELTAADRINYPLICARVGYNGHDALGLFIENMQSSLQLMAEPGIQARLELLAVCPTITTGSEQYGC